MCGKVCPIANVTGRLFDSNDRFTDEANELTNKAVIALQPIMDEYMRKGYSIREIAHLLSWAAKDVELAVALKRKL